MSSVLALVGAVVPALVGLAPARLPLSVYIEDTDAYAVVFYANYLRFWERAAVTALGAPGIGERMRRDGKLFGLQSAHGMRYAAAATLGDECEAVLEPLGVDADGRLAARGALVRVSDGKELCTAADLRFGFVSQQTGERISEWPEVGSGDSSWWSEVSDASAVPPADPAAGEVGAAPVPGTYPQLQPDTLALQLDEASSAGTLSLHAAARYFERHRTAFLGGPGGLQELADSGVNVVVGRINGFRLLPAAHNVCVGTPLQVRCRAILKARNTQILFEQWLTTTDGEPLARADVSCICLDPAAGKMCAAPPAAAARIEKWLS